MLDFPVKFLLGYFPDSNSIFKIGSWKQIYALYSPLEPRITPFTPVIPKNVYAVIIWLTGLIFVELPACGVYTLWYIGLWGVKPGNRPIWTVYELIDDTCDKIEFDRRWLLQLLRVCFTPKTAKKSDPLPCCRLMGRAFRAELRVSFTVKKRKKYRL